MRIHIICKRYYTNKDLIENQFGRLYHLPEQLVKYGAEVWVNAIDYRNKDRNKRSGSDKPLRVEIRRRD